MCQAEVEQRETNRIARAIVNAKFPIMKELGSFDFNLVQGFTKTRVLELAQGGHMAKAENIILIGNPGLGKSHSATGLTLAACRQRKKIRFFGVASLVNELLDKQDNSFFPQGVGFVLRPRVL